jgi:DNA-directed RNA polymerase subunit RPC12/RpoP
MIDITYCASDECLRCEQCKRHVDNNNLKGRIYSVSDFYNPDFTNCEFLIDDNNEPTETKSYYCEECGAELLGEPNIGYLGLVYIHCDECGYDNYIDELDNIILTKDNVVFPKHFFHFDGKDCVYITDEHINKMIQHCLNHLHKHEEDEYCQNSIGDVVVTVTRRDCEETYNIVVAKNYYETDIPY